MSWFTSLFSSSSKTSRNSRTAMSSTHEAFSLPTSSPSQTHHPDAFSPSALHTAQSHTLSSPTSYSYPPPSPVGSYDYVPNPSNSRSRESSLLPLHNPPRTPPYPPLEQTWNRLRSWLSTEYPELGDTLNFGMLPQDLAQVEMAFGFALPAPVRESYLCVDGQEPESAAGCSEGLFFGLTLLPLEDVLEEWRFWREVDDDPNTGANARLREMMQSIPPGWVRREYSSRGWIPLVADKAGNYLGIDMNPDEGGAVGQVIVFGRDFDTKVVIWRGDGPGGWAKWLASFVEDLEAGEGYEIGGDGTSEGSEDSIGYESYFYDGVGKGMGNSGGDSGTGGMKLAGEYKGWNVLEAWADRSVRRWHEAGIIPDPVVPQPDKGKNIAPNVVNLPDGSGAQVPIPVLVEDESTTPLGNATNRETAPKQSIPTISVTKPPAPAPFDLPTADDILVTSESETPLAEPDLEAGGDMVMREIIIPPQTSPVSPGRTTPAEVRQAVNVPLPSSPIPRILTSSPDSVTPPAPAVSDLLEDPAPMLPTPTITPSPTSSSANPPEGDKPDSAKSDEESPVMVSAEDSIDASLDTTIRLVGGGGITGSSDLSQDGVLVSEPEEEAIEVPLTDIPLASSTETVKKHQKKNSTSSKRFSILSKRRKDSVNSTKEVV
ncbi:unnamed protein product [Somion occarium]|uniref:Knr4/Smi1-like domain-containing protein n=1 Tax=Somion occarium TaxID=3059160 RepID=A0ABP1DD25_9APHY